MKKISIILLCLFSTILFIKPAEAVAPYVPIITPPTFEEKMIAVFGDQADLMTSIFKAESGLKHDAIGYNCHYTNEAGKRYSGACKPSDRYLAWSVDCGIAQINTKGQKCPPELLDEDYNLMIAKKKLDTEGLNAWVVYKNRK